MRSRADRRRAPHLCFHVGELARLRRRLVEQVGADLDHRGRLVLHGVLLDLHHLLLHAVLDVALQLRESGAEQGGRAAGRAAGRWILPGVFTVITVAFYGSRGLIPTLHSRIAAVGSGNRMGCPGSRPGQWHAGPAPRLGALSQVLGFSLGFS